MRALVLLTLLAGLVNGSAQAQANTQQKTFDLDPAPAMQAVPVPPVETQPLAPPGAAAKPLATPAANNYCHLTYWLLAVIAALLAGGSFLQWRQKR